MGKKSKSKGKKKKAAAAATEARASDKERDEKRIHRAATQFPPRTKELLQPPHEMPTSSPGWFPDKESVLATARSEYHRVLLDRMVDHDHECQRIMERLDKLFNQGKHAEVVKLATDTIENTKEFVTSIYGKMITCKYIYLKVMRCMPVTCSDIYLIAFELIYYRITSAQIVSNHSQVRVIFAHLFTLSADI